MAHRQRIWIRRRSRLRALVADVPSMGCSHKIPGVKVERIHHLLSDLERAYLLVCEFSEDVVDIREQYPLLPE